MGLIASGFRLSASSPMRVLGAPLAGVVDRANWNNPGSSRNMWCGDAGISSAQGIPSGHRHPSSWVMAPKPGGVASRGEIDGEGALTGAIAGGLYGEASLTGDGDLAATVSALAQAATTLAGTGDLTGAIEALALASAALSGSGDLSATIGALADIAAAMSGSGDVTGAMSLIALAAATLSGSGDLTGAAGAIVAATAALSGSGDLSADVVGTLAAAATLAGSGDLAGAVSALAHAVAAITGAGDLAGAPGALGHIGATISSEGELLTTGNVAAAVWNAVAASFVGAGTMGEALNTAGSGGLSPTQATMLLELYRLAGLDPTLPLVVTATTREVDDGSDIAQTVVEAPAGTITVTRT